MDCWLVKCTNVNYVLQFPKGHPSLARLMQRLAKELHKVGRAVDARYLEEGVINYARQFSPPPRETIFEQDVEFLVAVASKESTSSALTAQGSVDRHKSASRSKPDACESRPRLKWADE